MAAIKIRTARSDVRRKVEDSRFLIYLYSLPRLTEGKDCKLVKGIGSAYGTILASFFRRRPQKMLSFSQQLPAALYHGKRNHLPNNMVLVQGLPKEPHPRSPILAFKY